LIQPEQYRPEALRFFVRYIIPYPLLLSGFRRAFESAVQIEKMPDELCDLIEITRLKMNVVRPGHSLNLKVRVVFPRKGNFSLIPFITLLRHNQQ
jgi:hypothetical protein